MQKNIIGFKKLKLKIIEKKKEKKTRKKKEKRKTPQNCKSPMQRQRLIIIIESVTEYTQIHIHPQAKSKQSNKYRVQQIDPANKGKQKLYLPEQN